MKKLLPALLFLLPLVVSAQEDNSALNNPETERCFQLTVDLASYGYEHKDALSLIMAARLSTNLNLLCQSEGGENGVMGSLDRNDLLSTAREYAGNNDLLLDLIHVEMNQPMTRAVKAVLGYKTGEVDARGTVSYVYPLPVKDRVRISVYSNEGTRLSITVYDSFGNRVGASPYSEKNPVCSFSSKEKQEYKVEIANEGRSATKFYFVVDM